MPIDKTVWNKDLGNMLADDPVAVGFGGVSASGTIDTLNRIDTMEDDGLRGEFRFSVYIRLSDFSAAVPDVDDEVTLDGTTHLVLATWRDPGQQMLKLDLAEEDGTA